MSKFLYLQDFHITGKNPINRLDNYYQSMLKKLDEILSIAKEQKVDFIIDGGDFFNSYLVSNTIVDDVLDKIESAKISWNMLYGNHCLLNGHIENSKATSLAHMFNRSKYVSHLEKIAKPIENWQIDGIEYDYNIEEDIKKKGLKCSTKAKYKIAIVHALIALKSLPSQVIHVVAKDIKTNYDIIFVAHYHIGWGIKEINKTKFINLSCIGRRSKNETIIKPKVAILDTKKGEVEVIELKTAKPYKEVFDLKALKEIKSTDEKLKIFINSLKSTKIQSLDMMGIVKEVGEKSKVDSEVMGEITKRIESFEDKEC